MKVGLVHGLGDDRFVPSLDEDRYVPDIAMLLRLLWLLLLRCRAPLPLLLLLLSLLFSSRLRGDIDPRHESRLAIGRLLVVPVLRRSRHGANVALLLGVLHVVLVLAYVESIAQPVLGYLLLLLFGLLGLTAAAALGTSVLVRLLLLLAGIRVAPALLLAPGEGHVGPGRAQQVVREFRMTSRKVVQV